MKIRISYLKYTTDLYIDWDECDISSKFEMVKCPYTIGNAEQKKPELKGWMYEDPEFDHFCLNSDDKSGETCAKRIEDFGWGKEEPATKYKYKTDDGFYFMWGNDEPQPKLPSILELPNLFI